MIAQFKSTEEFGVHVYLHQIHSLHREASVPALYDAMQSDYRNYSGPSGQPGLTLEQLT